MIYNVDLLDNSIKKEIKIQRFIDNITFIIITKSIRGNNQKLAKVYNSVYKN